MEHESDTASASQEFRPSTETGVRPVQPGDLEAVRAIVEQWVRDANGQPIPDEIDQIMAYVHANAAENNQDRRYLIAQTQDGTVAGIMGLTASGDDMKPYAHTDHPLEIVNAFVSGDQRGQGIGHKLEAAIEDLARESGATELMVNSGPRYQDAWKFYDQLFGPPVVVLENQYGPGNHAPVWRKNLT
jgi:GNAT superfamily N-acetyltransferase